MRAGFEAWRFKRDLRFSSSSKNPGPPGFAAVDGPKLTRYGSEHRRRERFSIVIACKIQEMSEEQRVD